MRPRGDTPVWSIGVHGDNAGIVFGFNGHLISISISTDWSSSPQCRQNGWSTNQYCIALLTGSMAPAATPARHREMVQKVRDTILAVGARVFSGATTPAGPWSAEGRKSLQSLLYPAIHTFRMRETRSGDAIFIAIHPSQAFIMPDYRRQSISITDFRLDGAGSLILRYALDEIVIETFRDHARYITCLVKVYGQDMFCKAWRDKTTFRGAAIVYEVKALHRMRNEIFIGNYPSARIPQLQGLVHDDEAGAIGFLRQWVPGRRLDDIDISATSIDSRRKWATQIRETVDYLHGLDLLWKVGKVSHVIIDQRGEPWLIDIGAWYAGGSPNREDDRQAVEKIVEFLQLDNDDDLA